MRYNARSCFLRLLLIITSCLIATACSRAQQPPPPDKPRLTPNVVLRDVTFRSAALQRDMSYRVIMPANVPPGKKLPVVYLLHGSNGTFRDWTNNTDVAHFAESSLLLVMPEGDSSYYTNAVHPPEDRYEDYIVHDLISDVEQRFPAATDRANRAIAGISMGGFGAVKIALHHSDLFSFSGGMSSALDVPRRAFDFKRFDQSRHYFEIFGSADNPTRRDNDPYRLVRTVKLATPPYFFISCGDEDPLLPANEQFATDLREHGFLYNYRKLHGGHDWNQWSTAVPLLFQSLLDRLALPR